MKVLVTGGAGYIGSVTSTALEAAGHVPVVLDSLVTGRRELVRSRAFYLGDIADRRLLRRIVDDHPDIECTIHMAARTVVEESVSEPALYYRENFAKSLDLVEELVRLDRPRVVFSSSAAVYAAESAGGLDEAALVDPVSPYARSKLMAELAMRDMAEALPLCLGILRYFNPIGASPDLTAGSPVRRPSHVVGQLLAVARGELDAFTITGTDLPTRDGTGVRDYVHVWDVARAHVLVVEQLEHALRDAEQPWTVFNVGTGRGTTVRELLDCFEAAIGRRLPVREAASRAGDVVGGFANVEKMRRVLGWSAESTVTDGVVSALKWDARREATFPTESGGGE